MLRYLKGLISLGVFYRKGSRLEIIGYSDADWVGSKNDSKSISGYCMFVIGNLVTWRSRNQGVVAKWRVKVEYTY